MKPIAPPRIVRQGIAIYVPSLDKFTQAKIEIFYSPKNPLFAWSFCDENPYEIWEKLDYQYEKGIIFIYNSPTILPKGFYKIQITVLSNNGSSKTGSKVYGLLTPKESLHIGFHYSAFPTIPLA